MSYDINQKLLCSSVSNCLAAETIDASYCMLVDGRVVITGESRSIRNNSRLLESKLYYTLEGYESEMDIGNIRMIKLRKDSDEIHFIRFPKRPVDKTTIKIKLRATHTLKKYLKQQKSCKVLLTVVSRNNNVDVVIRIKDDNIIRKQKIDKIKKELSL